MQINSSFVTSENLMTVDQLQKTLSDLVCAETDLKAILVYDKDGIPIVQAHSTDCPLEFLEPWLSSTFLISCEQVRPV
jgi:predicted regulator of Ras-like GTPase activity (Roadblock/LC7/MglB family)